MSPHRTDPRDQTYVTVIMSSTTKQVCLDRPSGARRRRISLRDRRLWGHIWGAEVLRRRRLDPPAGTRPDVLGRRRRRNPRRLHQVGRHKIQVLPRGGRGGHRKDLGQPPSRRLRSRQSVRRRDRMGGRGVGERWVARWKVATGEYARLRRLAFAQGVDTEAVVAFGSRKTPSNRYTWVPLMSRQAGGRGRRASFGRPRSRRTDS
jgi:hypothetical protein